MSTLSFIYEFWVIQSHTANPFLHFWKLQREIQIFLVFRNGLVAQSRHWDISRSQPEGVLRIIFLLIKTSRETKQQQQWKKPSYGSWCSFSLILALNVDLIARASAAILQHEMTTSSVKSSHLKDGGDTDGKSIGHWWYQWITVPNLGPLSSNFSYVR